MPCLAGRVDWVRDFYSTTGRWWGDAEATITDRDHGRAAALARHAGTEAHTVLELGAGYGTTAAALALAGYEVTAVEISDRVAFAVPLDPSAPGSFELINDDFYAVDLCRTFDVVGYWNGFGVGTDADQRRLLSRIAADWLRPGGVALIDVFNPFVWARWDGDEEFRARDVAAGYHHDLHERTTFDPVTCTATDTWWDAGRPEDTVSQVLRCYSPADLSLLLAGTGLVLTEIAVGDRVFRPAPQPGMRELLADHHEYLAVLRPG